MNKHLFIFFIILFAGIKCLANDYNIEYLTTEQGLTQNEVTIIVQDQNGFMWFGTRGGLNRFDGYEFIHFKPKVNSSKHLSNPSIEALFEDSNGNLWVGTKSGGLNFYNSQTGQFSHILSYGKPEQKIEDIRIISFAETLDKRIIIGTWSDGLYICDRKNTMLHHLFENIQVNDILVTDNFAWIATNEGFYKMSLEDYSIDLIELDNTYNITECQLDKKTERIWLAGWECGLISYSYNTGEYERFKINPEFGSLTRNINNTYSLLLDSKNDLWVGTWNFGLFKFDIQKKAFEKVVLGTGTDVKYNSNYTIILDIYEDDNQNIWIGTDSGGIIKLRTSKTFSGLSLENNPDCGLTNFNVNSFWKSEEGTLYVGTRGGGLFKTSDNLSFTQVLADEKLTKTIAVKDIFPMSEDKLWISYDDRCYELDIRDENAKISRIDNEYINQIRKITALKKVNNALIIGTQQNGLYFFPDMNNMSQSVHLTPQNNEVLKNERITFIETDNEGRIWIGTFKGVYNFNLISETITPVRFADHNLLTGDITSCWHQSNDSIFWIGTPNGLNELIKTAEGDFRIKHFDKESGLPDDYILGILSSKSNEIWLSTNSGIVKILIDNERIYSFDKSDGIQSLNFSESKGYCANDETMYFGNTNGYTFFKSNDIEINRNIPPVVFTKFKIFNTEITPFSTFNGKTFIEKLIYTKPTIHLSHKEKEFSIEFSSLNYNSPQRNQYAYKLEGYDEDWVNAGTKRSVTYINLKPGEYVFHVRGSNNNYVWNMKGAALPLVIHSAPWKTWYAIIIYIMFIIAVVLVIRWNAIKQVNLANSLEMEKMQHAQEQHLHEIKLRFFTNISHEFRTPLTLILGPVKEMLDKNSNNKQLKLIYKNSKRLLTLVNQLLEFRKMEADSLKLKASNNNVIDFVKEICISFEELASINQIDFRLELNLNTTHLWFDLEKMEIILNNLISNAFKYSGANAIIKVLLKEDEDSVSFHIIDGGPGIDKNEIDKIFNRFYQVTNGPKYSSSGIGLHLVKQMVELHKGEISVQSVPNEITEFCVRLKKDNKHLSPGEMVETIAFYSTGGIFNSRLATHSSNENTTDNTGTGNKKILIVEDNAEIRAYLEELFQKEFDVRLAENGKVAYQKAKEEDFDLIISDIMMPELDGIELCKSLKSNIETSHIPVILLTAKSASQFRIEGLSYGAEAYVSKPFNPNELRMQVQSILMARNRVKEKFGKTITLEPTKLEITSNEERFIELVLKSVEDNIDNSEFKSDDLAGLAGVSVTTLYRKLKALTGQSSNELIRSVRIKRAAQLLKDTSYSVSEITYMVGFNDIKYFRKCFQNQFSETPSSYRSSFK